MYFNKIWVLWARKPFFLNGSPGIRGNSHHFCAHYPWPTLLMLEMEYSSFGVNTMPADALAPKLARASAAMVLAVYDRQHILLFHS